MTPTLTAISCGAGVQSTTLQLLVRDGVLPRPDVAIFADTGWEPAAVYAQVDRLEALAVECGIEFHRVSQGNLHDDATDPEHRYASIPYFVRNPDGSEGMGRRQCTSEYKLSPITRKLRELLGAKPPEFRRVPRGRVAEQWVGFSTDEVGRANRRKDSQGVQYLTTRYPLLDLGMSRADCLAYLERAGWGHTEKSACIGCPFHGNAQWRELRDRCASCGHHRDEHWRGIPGWTAASDPDVVLDETHLSCAHSYNPDAGDDVAAQLCACPRFDDREWVEAVAFDAAIRKGGSRGLPLNGEAFLHRSRVPLAEAPIDRVTQHERDQRHVSDQPSIFLELLEHGEPQGCSPYGCRNEADQ